MATLIPPASKKQKKEENSAANNDTVPENLPNVLIKFQSSETGESIGSSIRVPGNISEQQLEQLLNQMNSETDDPVPYTFDLLDKTEDGKEDRLVEIRDNLYTSVLKPQIKTTEDFLTLLFTPRAVFKVKPITRSSASIAGHGSTILCCQFAPNNSGRMCSGAGDSTARVWDCHTQTPLYTLTGHTNWVLCVSYSPCGSMIATGSMDNTVRLWDSALGKCIGNTTLKGHSKWISSLTWEPLHLISPGQRPRLASGSKDGTVRVWDTTLRVCVMTMGGHTNAVSCIKWSGSNIIYSGSHDKTIRAWDIPAGGRCIQILKSHAHWVNHLSTSSDYVLRKGGFDHTSTPSSIRNSTPEDLHKSALEQYDKVSKLGGKVSERIVTASDDFTMYLWEPLKSSKPICRMTGHQKLVNYVSFSPDGRYIVSCSFDNSVKIWDGIKGTFLASLRGHVALVYQCAWSPDSRLLVTCSKDTTLKVWDIRSKKLMIDLPGHADEVYAVDWSLDGSRVASGGKDKHIRLWSH